MVPASLRSIRWKLARLRVIAEDRGGVAAILAVLTYPWRHTSGLRRRVRYRHIWERLYGPEFREFDEKYGVSTTSSVRLTDLRDLPASASRGNDCISVTESGFGDALRAVPLDLSGYAFIDIGSGAGKALILAALHGLRQIIGVEFSPELHTLAQQNLQHVQRTLLLPNVHFTLHCMDAADFQPPTTRSLVYMFNPFDRTIMTDFIGNLERHFSTHREQQLAILYLNPLHKDVLDRSIHFELVALRPSSGTARRNCAHQKVC